MKKKQSDILLILFLISTGLCEISKILEYQTFANILGFLACILFFGTFVNISYEQRIVK